MKEKIYGLLLYVLTAAFILFALFVFYKALEQSGEYLIKNTI